MLHVKHREKEDGFKFARLTHCFVNDVVSYFFFWILLNAGWKDPPPKSTNIQRNHTKDIYFKNRVSCPSRERIITYYCMVPSWIVCSIARHCSFGMHMTRKHYYTAHISWSPSSLFPGVKVFLNSFTKDERRFIEIYRLPLKERDFTSRDSSFYSDMIDSRKSNHLHTMKKSKTLVLETLLYFTILSNPTNHINLTIITQSHSDDDNIYIKD